MSDSDDSQHRTRYASDPSRRPPPHPESKGNVDPQEEHSIAFSKSTSLMGRLKQKPPFRKIVTSSVSLPPSVGSVAADYVVLPSSSSAPVSPVERTPRRSRKNSSPLLHTSSSAPTSPTEKSSWRCRKISLENLPHLQEEIRLISHGVGNITSKYRMIRSSSEERVRPDSSGALRKWVRCHSITELSKKGQWYAYATG